MSTVNRPGATQLCHRQAPFSNAKYGSDIAAALQVLEELLKGCSGSLLQATCRRDIVRICSYHRKFPCEKFPIECWDFLDQNWGGEINLKGKAVITVHELTFYLKPRQIKKSIRAKPPQEVWAEYFKIFTGDFYRSPTSYIYSPPRAGIKTQVGWSRSLNTYFIPRAKPAS